MSRFEDHARNAQRLEEQFGQRDTTLSLIEGSLSTTNNFMKSIAPKSATLNP